MNLLISCLASVDNSIYPCPKVVAIDMNEENHYTSICPSGHHIHVALGNQKFELLFESAALALLDGYRREAIAGFSSALERFYEFYIQVIVHKNMIFGDSFSKTWKELSSRSERQLGAFRP